MLDDRNEQHSRDIQGSFSDKGEAFRSDKGEAFRSHGPSAEQIRNASIQLATRIVETPIVQLKYQNEVVAVPDGSSVTVKLEMFQRAGSFKARGALLNIDAMEPSAKERGVVTASAGNHALALSWAAGREGISAKVVMPKYADSSRVSKCKALGADVVLVEDIHSAFAQLDTLVEQEGRTAIHPFEGEQTVLGTATCGWEFIRQAEELDVVVIPVGGGGLISGIARAVKLYHPSCEVIGVEPSGAACMFKSLQNNQPSSIENVDTIADSLGSPMTLPYTFGIVREHVDDIVLVSDKEMIVAMSVLYDSLRIVVEPAAAASAAAIFGPLRDKLVGKKIGIIACGSNISLENFSTFIEQGDSIIRGDLETRFAA